MAGEAGALDKRAPARRRPGLAREVRARLKVAANAVRLAGLQATAPVIGLSLAVVLWFVSLFQIHPRAMTGLGLVTVLPLAFFAALVILTASFATLVHRRPSSTRLLIAHLLALIAFLHATPAIVYGTLRASWAWKHVGIVDYIARHDGVKTNIDYLGIYHNWPSFFGFDVLLSDIAGLGDTIELAIWWPVAFNVLTLGALLFVFSALTRDKRIIWLGSWIFMIANWVGQDYFSPQAFAFFFYLIVIGAVLRWLRPGSEDRPPRGASPPQAAADGKAALRLRLRAWWEAQRRDQRWPRRLAVAFIVMALVAIASSHALTSMMVTLALAALVVFKLCRVRSLPIVSAAIVALWAALFASNFVTQEGLSFVQTIHLPWVQAERNLGPVGERSADQQLIAHASLALMLAVGAVAAFGAVRELRAGRLDRTPVILAVVPGLLMAGGDYGGEMLFRIFMFALPFVSLLAAYTLLPRARSSSRFWWPAIATAIGCTALVIGFMVTYFGQDREFYYTPQEVEASKYMYGHAPTDALLIEGTTDYPRQFENYEKFRYATLSQQPRRSQKEISAQPVSVMTDWMSDPTDNGAFLIITRSMKAEVSGDGVLPPHSLDRIQRALMRSPRFRIVFQRRGAVVFTLAPGQENAPA